MKKRIIIDNILYDYYIYDDGKVYSEKTNKYLKPRKNRDGYLYVRLYTTDGSNEFYVHRLVATMYLDNPNNLPEVNHKNGNKECNYVWNLEWVTKSENVIHAYKTNLKHGKIGSGSHLAKYGEDIIRDVCIYLEEGLLTIKEISNITNVSFGMVWLIITHKSWTNISNNYNIVSFGKNLQI